MLKIGNLVVAGTVAGITLGAQGCAVSPPLNMAALSQDQRPVREGVANCREQAEIVTQGDQARQTQNALARGAISLVGSVIRGSNSVFPAQNAATGILNGAYSDSSRVERTKDAEFNRCMREQKIASR